MFLFFNCYDIIYYESTRFRAVKKSRFLNWVNLLWMWFFPIVPIRDRVVTEYMGIAFILLSLKNVEPLQNQGMATLAAVMCWKMSIRNKPPTVQALKTVWSNGCYPNAPCVLPSNLMAECPHCGQQQMSFFQICFIRSAIPRPVYRCLNFWYPWSLKISFRFLYFMRLLRKP